jgi:hypothetical protein
LLLVDVLWGDQKDGNPVKQSTVSTMNGQKTYRNARAFPERENQSQSVSHVVAELKAMRLAVSRYCAQATRILKRKYETDIGC